MDAVPSERRATARHAGANVDMVRFQLSDQSSCFSATIADFSILGIGIVVTSACAAGTELTFLPGRHGAKFTDHLSAEVRHATELGNGTWRLGCRFSRILTLEDVLALT